MTTEETEAMKARIYALEKKLSDAAMENSYLRQVLTRTRAQVISMFGSLDYSRADVFVEAVWRSLFHRDGDHYVYHLSERSQDLLREAHNENAGKNIPSRHYEEEK